MNNNEKQLILKVLRGKFPGEAACKIGMSPERVTDICSHWKEKEWYEYKLCLTYGWFTKKGREYFGTLDLGKEK